MQGVSAPSQDFVPTGLPELDAAWEGGYRPGELGMVVAPTGVGKSMLLSMFAAEAYWAGKSVMYMTYELTPAQIRKRIATAILGKGPQRLNGTWAEELEFAHLSRGKTTPPPGPIEIHNDASTWPEVEAKLERFKDTNGKYPDVLLLDSADDVAFRVKTDKRYEGLLDVFVYQRNLAHEKNMAIWTTAQLNRESVEKARVNLRMIGDAFRQGAEVALRPRPGSA
jgi:KaiC/GvpD/RAD55 family RecA-like ATPase